METCTEILIIFLSLTYGCEIWGLSDVCSLEKVHTAEHQLISKSNLKNQIIKYLNTGN